MARQIDYIASFWEIELESVRVCIQRHTTENDDIDSEDSPTQWTDCEVYLVELAYSIYWAGSVNNGKTTKKAIMNKLGKAFGVDLKDGYRTYSDVTTRKNRTKYLDVLKSSHERELKEKDKR